VPDKSWERYAWMAGIASIVLFVVATFIAGNPPNPNDSVQKVFNYVHGNIDAIRWSSYIIDVGLVLFAFWLAALTSSVRRALKEPSGIVTLVIVGGVIGIALGLVGTAIASVDALRIRELGPSGLHFFFGLGALVAAAGDFGTALLVGAIALAGVRGTGLPSWFVAASGLLAVAFLVAGLGIATFSSGIVTFGLIVFLVWALWVVGISVLRLMGSESSAAT
jgi:hypothetical protein